MKILLVEDDQVLSEMYQEQFKGEGFNITAAKDSQEAYEKLSDDFDVILLDILLPGENGFEILKRIKADEKYKKIPVIILTNLGTERTNKDTDLAMALGASDFLIKAYHTPDEVIKKIKQVIKQKAA